MELFLVQAVIVSQKYTNEYPIFLSNFDLYLVGWRKIDLNTFYCMRRKFRAKKFSIFVEVNSSG